MYKVLIVEDDPIQIEWAKKELEGLDIDLVVAQTMNEADDHLNEGIDFILQDLQIPKNEEGDPEPAWGQYLYRKTLEMFADGFLKGIALVSNFHHHNNLPEDKKYSGELNSFADNENTKYLGHKLKGGICQKHYDNNGRIIFLSGSGLVNLIFLCDTIDTLQFPFYYYKGSVIPREIFKNQWRRGDITWDNVIMLKPWREVLITLIEGSEK
jgi:hypothetical protein